ncbi:PrsW family intramembrane metalloprotease [Clostridium sediminicola]|uniref:PrsW family intramembrane metalloprotease n=1 Tax=Clostridium sediminicola TaxID=3114879 RepID=UPI0031F23DCB
MYLRLFVIAIFPGIALALAAYLTDRFDREPVKLLGKVFLFGALSVIPTAAIEGVLSYFNIFIGVLRVAFTAFIVAGFTEEFIKREVVMRLAYKNPAFDEKLDGIIYAVFASLGFATAENVIYVVFRFATNPYVGISRGIFSVPAHMLFAITMGYYLSLAKFCIYPNLCKAYYRKALTVPLVLHGIFDFILMLGNGYMFLVFIPFVIYLWIINLRKLNEYYRDSKNRASKI